MYKGKRIIGVIPARGGSKGLPGKNIAEIDGKPLIYYSIWAAQHSAHLDACVVSTDSEEIATIARGFGAQVVMRPDELAQDTTPTVPVLKHVLDHFAANGETFDTLILLEPTSPMRTARDVDAAIEQFTDHAAADALVSLGEIQLESPYIAKTIGTGYLEPLIKLDAKFHQRQQLPKAYFPYGVIYISKVATLLATGTFYQERTIPYLIERWQNYEVDDIYDLKAIEGVMRYRRQHHEQ